MTTQELWQHMWRSMNPPGLKDAKDVKAYAHLAQAMEFTRTQWVNDEVKTTTYWVPVDTKVKILTASRMGWLGITDQLDDEHGYKACLLAHDGSGDHVLYNIELIQKFPW